MSQSPATADGPGRDNYFDQWNTLATMISQGLSFSGRERDRVFLNTRGPQFADASAVLDLDLVDDGRGIGVVDWDQDGDLDLWYANRDGIGARLELYVRGQTTPLIKTLRAGEGFVSQSSKWVQFGLGPDGQVDRLSVRWPDGSPAEEFGAIAANGRYRITQGTRRAKPVPPRDQQSLRLSAEELPLTPNSDAARIVLTQPRPWPAFSYVDLQGNSRAFAADSPATLVVLWAHWCPPCIAELTELQRQTANLRQQGLEIVALSVDGVADGDLSPAAATQAARDLART